MIEFGYIGFYVKKGCIIQDINLTDLQNISSSLFETDYGHPDAVRPAGMAGSKNAVPCVIQKGGAG